jgi:DeoR/GlpR family transcriptional regulator of sugar metabolism
MRAETVRDMVKQAAQVIILTESEKFSKQGLVPLLPFERVSRLITDSAIPLEKERFLTVRKISVLKVPL